MAQLKQGHRRKGTQRICDDVYQQLKSYSVDILTGDITKVYKLFRMGEEAFAYIDVHAMVIRPLLKDGRLKKVGHGRYIK